MGHQAIAEPERPQTDGDGRQHLPRARQKRVNLLLGARIDHVHGPGAVGARQARRGAEQATDQRPLRVYLAAVLAQMRATEFGERAIMFGFGLDRQTRHLFR